MSIEKDNYLGKFEKDAEYLTLLQIQIEDLYNPNSPNFRHPTEAKIEETKLIFDEKIRYINSFYDITRDYWTTVKALDTKNRIGKIYGIFFQRYHYAIGHYFRHLYHIIKFAKDLKSSSETHVDIIKKYVDFIQAQMSSFEMMLLFYNAISFPKLLDLLIEFNFLENLAEEDLIDISHNCIDGIKLKSRKELLGD